MADTMRLGDIVTIERGSTYKSALLDEPGPVLLGLGTINRHGGFRSDSLRTYGGESPDKMLVRPGELYASLKDVTQSADLLGAVARLPLDSVVGRLTQDTVRLDIRTGTVAANYLYWMLRTPQYRQYCRAHATGTTTMGLPRESFFDYLIPRPSRERLALVDVLGALDDKIAANDHTLRLMDELVRARFESLTGEPVPLSQVAVNWRRQVDPDQVDPETKYVGLEHVPRRMMWLTEADVASDVTSAKSTFAEGDVLFGKLRPYFHKVVRAPFGGICSTDILVVRAKDPGLAGFVLAAASSDRAVRETTAASEGTRMPRTKWADLGSVEVPWPGEAAGRSFGRAVNEIGKLAGSVAEESWRLEHTRDELLPLLMSGRIRVKDAEKTVEEVL